MSIWTAGKSTLKWKKSPLRVGAKARATPALQNPIALAAEVKHAAQAERETTARPRAKRPRVKKAPRPKTLHKKIKPAVNPKTGAMIRVGAERTRAALPKTPDGPVKVQGPMALRVKRRLKIGRAHV